MLIDSHCHLDAPEFDQDRDAVVQRAQAAGVSRWVVPAVNADSFAATLAMRAYPGAALAFGLHPVFLNVHQEAHLAVLADWLAQHEPVAIGETGLDFFVPGLDAARQVFFFEAQLKLARDLDLPVIVHIRRSQDQVLKYLRKWQVRGGIAHAFNGSEQQAEAFIKLGFKLGFGGAMTYSGSHRIRRLAAHLPLEALVLETDAPDIPPTWLDKQRNEPAEMLKFAEVLAELRGSTVAAITAATVANTLAALPRLNAQWAR